MLYSVDKQAYKLELPEKWKTYNLLHISILEQNTKKKKRGKKILELNDDNDESREYEVEAI